MGIEAEAGADVDKAAAPAGRALLVPPGAS